ncbi:FAD-dependent monooxygenase [Amycolatopsis sp. EV170708-02-1]|uniref:FAD-dependent monooxygenase n=1 Tax=Amycolatopsis sp. EV170708-02-1 TaxID=2919322 RepID=UPI001F0BC60A|nr:FAD-dependent monooxygenase [Amycolatopsis sp. EV170708-02-1]UMP07011.1 FAD-dependent monooxygenase [Amycolatopsis sp. EV170708-02-1]
MIVGAGVGGSFLALLLGRKGLRVVVVDANPGPGHRGADILKPRAIRLLAEHGLLDRLRSRGALQRDRIDFYHDGVSLLPYDFVEHTELGHYLVVPYVETVGTILEACAELPNVDVRFDSKIAAVTTAGATATEAILHNGARISARAFVDSSGSATPLRDLVRPHFDTLTYDHVLRMATVPLSSESDLRNRLYFGSTGWLAYFYPVTADSARIFLGVPRDQDARSHTGKYLNSLPVLYSFVPEADEAFRHLETAEFEPAPISAYTSKPYHHGNVILLGSSVFACHPMTGQGMSYSMEDAAVLTSILSEARDDLELSRLLDRHYETRRPAHERLVQYGDSLARSFHDKAAYLRAHDAVMHGGDL